MVNRRRFLATAGAACAAFRFDVVPRSVLGGPGHTPPSDKLNIAGIGVAGRGRVPLGEAAQQEQNIVALCDVDWQRSATMFQTYPAAERFTDYRILLDKRQDIDAVVIATPDHMHAPIALAALRAGKHVYVEKPMAHSVEEARLMTRAAKETGLVTQMGNQGHAGEGLRLMREWIQAGLIGTVREIHGWSDRPTPGWNVGKDAPTESQAIPPDFDWNLWLGGAAERPYSGQWRNWRGWCDFGSGALGDMGIHNLDPAFYALDLGPPLAAEAQTSQPPKKDSYPVWEIITYEFAAQGGRPALKLIWFDGDKKPPRPADLESTRELRDNGLLFLGDKGTIMAGSHAGSPRLIPESRMQEAKLPDKTIPRSAGHVAEWVQACKDHNPDGAKAGFAYAGPYTEALLVGNLAVRLQKRIEWDAAAMKATDTPQADRLIRQTYRQGFGI